MKDAEEQEVRLEFVASVEIDALRVVRFVQELKEIPADAWCEVVNVTSKRQSDSSGRIMESVATTVAMRCERHVADFLCQQFGKQSRHVSQGELFMVRCRRVFQRTLPLANPTKRLKSGKTPKLQCTATAGMETAQQQKSTEKKSVALPRSTMIDLLDCLGDRIVDVLDAFQTHAVQSSNISQLTMVGLVKALAQLSKQDWSVNLDPRPISASIAAKPRTKEDRNASSDRIALGHVRHLLIQLIDHKVIAMTASPEANDTPFLSYTDFIAFYVAYMNTSTDQQTVQVARGYNNAARVK